MTEKNARFGQRDFDLGVLISLGWARRYLIGAFGLAGAIVAAIVALLSTPVYRAEAVIVEVKSDSMSGSASALANQIGGLASLVGVKVGDHMGEGPEAQALLRSRRLVEQFVQKYKLESVLQSDSKSGTSLWHLVRRFREGIISFRDDKRSGTTTVVVEWKDAESAALWANEFVALANEIRRNQVLEESQRNVAYLNEQIAKTNIVEVQRVMYNLIEAETKKIMLANARPEFAFAIVDPAVAPELRIRPQRKIMVVVGLLLGVFAGFAWAAIQRAVPRLRASGLSALP